MAAVRAKRSRRRDEQDLATRAEALREEHERLCFQRAYPRTRSERLRAERGLARFESRIAAVRAELVDTGIAGTTYSYPYSYRISQWLLETQGAAVTIDWAAYMHGTWDELSGLLSLLVGWAEIDGVDEEDRGAWDWVRAALAGHKAGALSWLIARLKARGFPPDVARHLYETVELPLRWDLTGRRESVTHLTVPSSGMFTSRTVRRERPADFAAAVRERIGPLTRVPASRARRLIHVARAALSLREREFYVITNANPEETYRTRCGRGLDIVMFGLPKTLRLPLEANYGCLLLRNGVPIGYAYGAVLFDRCDIGINIFPTYRDGESAYAFTKVAALFRKHFGSRIFIVRRYQVGYGNPEGIDAGSFWFYWRLGFRPIDARVRALGEAEARRLQRRRGARSDAAMLRRLARSDVVWHCDGYAPENHRDYDVAAVGNAVTRMIERRHRSDRRAAELESARRVARAIGVRRVPPGMAPIAALIPRLDRWPDAEKRRLAAVLRTKFGRGERAYVLALLRADRFREFIAGV